MVTSVSANTNFQYMCGYTSANNQRTTENPAKTHTLEDVYVPTEDITKLGSNYYSKHINLGGYRPESLEGFTNSVKIKSIEDYNKQHPDSRVFYEPSQNGDIFFNGEPESLKSYLGSIDYKKEYEEYKQSRGCSSDEELTALNKVPIFSTKEQLITGASMTMISINADKYGPIAAQIAKSSNLSDLADFFNQNIGLESNEKENLLSDLLAKNAQNAPSPEAQAQAMKEKYNSSLISKYAS